MNRYLTLIIISILIGCGAKEEPKEYPPISMEAAREFQAGAEVEAITAELGEPHPPTPAQASHMATMIRKMPSDMQKNAEKAKTLAWGNDEKFLVVKVGDDGVAWVTSCRE